MESERRKLIPFWVSVVAKLPFSVYNIVAIFVGAWRLIVGLLVYDRRHVLLLMQTALQISFPRTFKILLSAEINIVRSHIEFAEFEAISENDLSSWVTQHTEVENLEAFKSELMRRSSVLLLSTSFASHYYGLVASGIREIGLQKIIVLQPSAALDPLNAIGFYARLERAGASTIETIPSDSPYSLMRAIRSMKRGGAGVARFDSLPTETGNFLLTKMLEVELAFPASLLRMAQLADAAILPLFVFRRGGKFVTRFGYPVDIASDASAEALKSAAASLSGQVGKQIYERPNEYTAWHGFYEKARMASQIRAILTNDANSS